MAVAVAPAVLLLKRRKIGALIILGGVAMAVLGFFLPLSSSPLTVIHPEATTSPVPVISLSGPHPVALALPVASDSSAFALAKHAFDHGLLNSGGLGSMLVDLATRGGLLLIVGAALLCIAFNVLPMMRGFVGIAAGLGLFGVALELGVIYGERARTLAICAENACKVDPHSGIWLIAIGLVAALLGGALGAVRPLAGLITGVAFACTGAVLGSGVAYLVIAQHALDVTAPAIGAL